MSTANVRDVFRVRGRLVMNPTDLITTAFPHGGTSLGLVRDIEIVPEFKYKEILAEEWGGVAVENVFCGGRALLYCVMRSLDSDLMAKVFTNSAVSGGVLPLVTHKPGDPTGTDRPGYLMSANVIKLAFCPIDAPDRDPFFVMYKAIPYVQGAARLQMGLNAEMGIAIAFTGAPDLSKSGKVFQFGHRRDIVL